MKKTIFASATVFLFVAPALSCPNLSGTFTNAQSSAKIALTITQTGCENIDVTSTITDAYNRTTSSHYNVATDGALHKVLSPAYGMDEYMIMKFEGDHLNSVTIFVQNGPFSPVVTSTSDTLNLSSEGNLTNSNVSVDNVGRQTKTVLVYTRSTPGGGGGAEE